MVPQDVFDDPDIFNDLDIDIPPVTLYWDVPNPEITETLTNAPSSCKSSLDACNPPMCSTDLIQYLFSFSHQCFNQDMLDPCSHT